MISEMRVALLAIDVASIPKPDDKHQHHVIFDRVDDPVVGDSDTQTRATLESTCTRWPRILGEHSDGTLDPTANLRVELS